MSAGLACYGRTIRIAAEAPDYIVEYVVAMLLAQLAKDIAEVKGGIPLGETTITETIETVSWDPDEVDEDGKQLEPFEPFQIRVIMAECSVWWEE